MNGTVTTTVWFAEEYRNFRQDSLLLNICIRNPTDKTYSPPAELTWNTSESASLKALKQEISNSCNIPIDRLIVAKHCYDKFEWLVIEDNSNQKKTNKRWSNKKSNLRYTPYYIKDGDTIAIKDQQADPFGLDDFATAEDLKGQEILRRRKEEKMIIETNEEKRIIDGKRQRRQTRSSGFYEEWTFDSGDSDVERCIKKPEKGITIHVDDFR